MTVSSKHPQYSAMLPSWTIMRDTKLGEEQVKSKGADYLPPTSGMIFDGYPTANTPGKKAYDAYRKRAVFHEYVSDAIKRLNGILHQKPPQIDLPASMESMRENATIDGESLEMLLRKINEEQFSTGRLGLLGDLPVQEQLGDVNPYIALYKAEKIVNWDDGEREKLPRQNLNLVVLDESEYVRKDDFSWDKEQKYRVLVLGDVVDNEGQSQGAAYSQGVFIGEDANFTTSALVTPRLLGSTADEIPFVFCNSMDVVPKPEKPPLMSLANMALTVYRGEADYRQSLFMQGQDTLVVIGDKKSSDEDGQYRVGANATISLPQNGDAKFIGVSSQGLAEQRQALEHDRNEATTLAGQLIDAVGGGAESGEALKIRVSARTATLKDIAITGAFALESLLKKIAVWKGANPDEVAVMPNLDFTDQVLQGRNLVDYMTARTLGAPWSLQSIHEFMREHGLTNMSFEDELEAMADDPIIGVPSNIDDGDESVQPGDDDSGES